MPLGLQAGMHSVRFASRMRLPAHVMRLPISRLNFCCSAMPTLSLRRPRVNLNALVGAVRLIRARPRIVEQPSEAETASADTPAGTFRLDGAERVAPAPSQSFAMPAATATP